MFKSFQTKIVVLFATLFILIQALTFFSVYFATTKNLEAQAKQQLEYSLNVFDQTLSVNREKWVSEANIFSTDYGFRSAVTSEDSATIQSALQNFTERVSADRIMLFSLDNEIISDIGNGSINISDDKVFSDLIDVAYEYDEATTYLELNDGLYQFTIVPVLAPVPVAWVGMGNVIDQNSLNDIKTSLPSGVDITFVHQGENENKHPTVTTLNDELLLDVEPALIAAESDADTDIIDGAEYQFMMLSKPLPSSINDQSHQAVLTYSLDAAYSPYEPLAYVLIALLGLGIVTLIFGSVTVAKGISKPIKVLAVAARKIKVGHYEQINDINQRDEIGELADHFNQMVEGIREREDKIVYQAEHDVVTGLPNRSSLEKYLGIMLANHADTGHTFSVLQITIDHFDVVRNTLGYETARKLMKKIGRRLLRMSSQNNYVARISNVNFIIVAEGESASRSTLFAKQILEEFERPFNVDDFTIDCSIKIGISNCPEHADSIDLLVQRAAIAANTAKESVEQLSIYNAAVDKYDADKLSMMGDFRKSLEEGHVKFYYQPKINLRLGCVTHVEALVRWIHPERGFIPPDDFINMAEQTGHIKYLTEWGLEVAIKQCRSWIEENIDLNIAINLSARDLSNKRLPEMIIGLLEKYHVPRSRLVLEITESAIMNDPEQALGVLNALDGHGLMLSIDDYGTGYSSMSYLKKMPVKELKIDKSFVLDLAKNKEDEILVKSTIDLAHNLGLKVTAEGVEDEISLHMLKAFGCDVVQGYFISKPLPLADLYDFLENSPFGLSQDQISEDESLENILAVQ